MFVETLAMLEISMTLTNDWRIPLRNSILHRNMNNSNASAYKRAMAYKYIKHV